jgi:hypothetical protein
MKLQNHKVLSMNWIVKFGLNLIIFAKLLGTTTIGIGVVFALAISRKRLKLHIREILFSGIVFFQLVLSLLTSQNSSALNNTIFYYSFIPVYFLLKDRSNEFLIKFLKYLMNAMLIFSVLEFFALNSFLSKYVWYFGEEHVHRSFIMGFQRAQGLSAISSSSGSVAVLCLALFSIVSNESIYRYRIVVGTTVLFLMSGAGFFILLAYVFLTILFTHGSALHKIIILCLAIIAITGLILFFEEVKLNKFTLNYLYDIYMFKLNGFSAINLKPTLSEIMFGFQADPLKALILTTSDFAIQGLYISMGIISVFLLLIAPILIIGYIKEYKVVLVLCIISWVHYPVLPSPVGCVFFGIFLSLYRNSKRMNLFPVKQHRVK